MHYVHGARWLEESKARGEPTGTGILDRYILNTIWDWKNWRVDKKKIIKNNGKQIPSNVNVIKCYMVPFYQYGFTLIPTWISDYIHDRMWEKIAYPFEVWEWKSNFIPHFNGRDYFFIMGLKHIKHQRWFCMKLPWHRTVPGLQYAECWLHKPIVSPSVAMNLSNQHNNNLFIYV